MISDCGGENIRLSPPQSTFRNQHAAIVQKILAKL
jgi:hypothetical protein